jgi:hypothetical protein
MSHLRSILIAVIIAVLAGVLVRLSASSIVYGAGSSPSKLIRNEVEESSAISTLSAWIIANGTKSSYAMPTTASGRTTYFDDFSSYTPGLPPTGWLQRSTPTITPTVREVGGTGPAYRIVDFPEVPWQYWDKWLLKDGLVLSSSYTVTVKLNFQNSVADRAGLTIAWEDDTWNRIDIQPNVFWDDIEFRPTYAGPIVPNVVITYIVRYIPIDGYTDYWLRAVATDLGPGKGQVIVYWSTDGNTFSPVLIATGLANLTGLAGISTAGPHLPHMHFDDFSVNPEIHTYFIPLFVYQEIHTFFLPLILRSLY